MILIVEDDVTLAHGLQLFVESLHFECSVAHNGYEAIEVIKSKKLQGMIVDMMMPQMDGITLLTHIRDLNPKPFIIMASALDSLEDKVKAFECGADDYIVKPYHFQELGYRLHALCKRHAVDLRRQLIFAHSILDEEQLQCQVYDKSIYLSRKEFQLLFFLLKNANRIFTRQQLLDAIWGIENDSFDRTVDTHIKSIREKVRCCDFEIVTVRGIGYKGVIL